MKGVGCTGSWKRTEAAQGMVNAILVVVMPKRPLGGGRLAICTPGVHVRFCTTI